MHKTPLYQKLYKKKRSYIKRSLIFKRQDLFNRVHFFNCLLIQHFFSFSNLQSGATRRKEEVKKRTKNEEILRTNKMGRV